MKKILAAAAVLVCVIVMIFVRFSNPDDTETKLFLDNWWLIFLMIFAVLISIIYEGKDNNQ